MDPTKPDWQWHPLVVAALAISGTLGLTIAFYSAAVIPPLIAAKEFQIDARDRQIAEVNKRLEAAEKSAREATDRATALTAEVNKQKQRIMELSRENVFSTEDVYPKGFRQIRIGEPTAKIWDVYPKNDISDENELWISVTIRDAFVTRVTYYYEKIKGRNIITSVLFHIAAGDMPLVKAQLAEKFGDNFQPTKSKSLVLKNVRGHTLEVDKTSYYVTRQ